MTAFTLNGRAVDVSAGDDTPLLDVLRNHLGLMGTKFGCGLEQCGCCMVLIDGEPAKSCGKALSTVAGKSVLTIEGLGTPEHPHPCPGLPARSGSKMVNPPGRESAGPILREIPGEVSITHPYHMRFQWVNGASCGSHIRILKAVERAAAAMREGAGR